MNSSIRRLAATATTVLLTAGLAGGVTVGTTAPAGAEGASQPPARASYAAVGHRVSVPEQRATARLDLAAVARTSRPAAMPTPRADAARTAPAHGADGPPLTVRGVLPADARTPGALRATDNNGALWPYAATATPNRMTGKFYFDVDPSAAQDYRHCTGTAINSPNKSVVLVAGHCVWDATNRRWHTGMYFVPATENGSAPYGAFTVRYMSTTNGYYYNTAMADDMAMAVVNTDAAGRTLVARVGAQGIAFNQNVNLWRTSLGYPVTDSRWPGWTSSGNDLYFCQGTDTYYSSGSMAGQMVLGCRMTGGASGGPWLTGVNAQWLGIAGSVNSNKGWTGAQGAPWMFGPYFGSAEQAVWQTVRTY